jgi:ParB family chromosome partitioning protein
MQIRFIEVARIVEDPDQPRKQFDPEALGGLADSIRRHGILQPITVHPLSNVDMYRIVTGERRWRAAQMAGLEEVPCIVSEVPEEEVLTRQVVENLQREDLQPIEKARAIRVLKERLGATNREIGSRLGVSERAVGYLLDLMELPEEISSRVVASPNRPSEGQLTEKHARFLKQLNELPELQSAVVRRIEDERMNSDHTGRLVKALRSSPDDAERILSTPVDHLDSFFRDLSPAEPQWSPPAVETPSLHAEKVLSMVSELDTIRPSELPFSENRKLEDALTSLKIAVDGLLREVKLEMEAAR